MGKIAEYKGQGPSPSFNPGAVEQAGAGARSIAQAANQMSEVFQRQQHARDATFVSSRAIDLETRAVSKMAQWQKDYSGDPIGKEQKLQEMLQADIEELSGEAPSGDARASLQRMGDDLKRRYSVNGAQWANQQLVKNIGDDIDRSSQTLQLQAFRGSDPNQIEDLFKQHDTLLVAASTALSPESVQNIRDVGRREIVANMLEGMVDKDRIGDAQRLLDSKQYDEVLGADVTKRVYQTLERKREYLSNRQDKLLALKDKDPWRYLAEIGDAKAVPELQFQGDVGRSFESRAKFVDDMAKKHGMKLPLLSEREADHMADTFLEMNPRDAAIAMANLDDKVQDKYKVQFGAQLFAKEPSLGAALMMSADSLPDAQLIISGRAYMRKGVDGKAVKPPSDANVERDFDAEVASAIADPQARIGIRQAVVDHMVGSMFRAGRGDVENYTPADFKKSLNAVVGPIADINGQKTTSFRGKGRHFLDADDLEDLVDSLRDDEVEKIMGDVPRALNGEPMNLKKSRGRVNLQAVGDGVYRVFRDGVPALNKEKRVFELDLKRLYASRDGAPIKNRVGGYGRTGVKATGFE